MADKVVSADVVPKKFPVEASAIQYPPPGKRGTDNPLYATSSQSYGGAVPLDHQAALAAPALHEPSAFGRGLGEGDEVSAESESRSPESPSAQAAEAQEKWGAERDTVRAALPHG